MHQFSIKDIENLCGIKAHTLRAWEQRHQLCVAKRKGSQHRIYDDEDLKELLRVSFLYHNGYKVSEIAGLSNAEIDKLVEESVVTHNNEENYIHQLIEASLDFDKERFEKIINCLVLRIGIEKCIKNIFYPFLHRIGLLWMTNHAIPAQEHFASHIIRKKILVATDGIETSDKDKPVILVFAPTGEFHEIPLLTVNYFLKKYGSRTVYMGVDVALETLNYYLQNKPVQFVYTHVITCLNARELEDYLLSLRQLFPGKMILSGPACKHMESRLTDIKMIHSPDEMIAFAKMIAE